MYATTPKYFIYTERKKEKPRLLLYLNILIIHRLKRGERVIVLCSIISLRPFPFSRFFADNGRFT